ncbi:MAG: hypothetical protein JW729_10280 [Bacteroidales bacterium]|nr:hypothetical protein [Bacteroidales bacterium]
MENQTTLANPKKLNISDFPPEQKRRKEGWWKRMRRRQKQNAKFNRNERRLRRAERQKLKRMTPNFFQRLLFDFKTSQAERREIRKEKAKLKNKQPNFFKRVKYDFAEYRKEQSWKNKQAKKKKQQNWFWVILLSFFIGPILDLRDEIRAEREEKRLRKNRFPQPNFFQRLWLEYKETSDTEKQRKHLDRVVRKSLSFVVEEDKRVFSLREEINHMKDTWKALPWEKTREFQNMLAMTIVFVLTFSMAFLFFQLLKFSVAAAFGIPGVWRNGQVTFTIPDPSLLWTYSSVLSVYSVGPFALAIVGLVFQRLQRKQSDQGSFKSLFYMWIYLHSYIIVFGTFLAGVFTDRGFGYVMGWLYIPWVVEVPMALLSVIMLWVIGYKAGRKFLAFRHSDRFIDSVLPQLFYKWIYFYIPILVGIGILFLLGYNANDFTQNVVYLSIIAMLTPTLRFIPEKL